MYLLDTNHCSSLMDGVPSVVQRLREVDETNVATCVIVCGELTDMAYRSERVQGNVTKVSGFLTAIGVYTISQQTAEIYGRLKSDAFMRFGPKEKAKRRHFTLGQMGVGENDLWIAAIALQHGLTIVSADSDFARLQQIRPFLMENWLLPSP
jgi:tRNA(fMet)-specific endonuclease VapC